MRSTSLARSARSARPVGVVPRGRPGSSSAAWQRAASRLAAVTLTTPEGGELVIKKEKYTIGTSAACDLVVNGPKVFPEHASITTRGQQVFCTALAQEGEGLFDAKTFTWLDGSQLRKGTSYLLASGSILSLGEGRREYKVQFQEGKGDSPMLEMMIKALTANSSDDVKQALPDNLK